MLPAGLGSAEAVGHRLGQCSLCLRLSQALMSDSWIRLWQTGEAAAAGTTMETCDLKLRVGRFDSSKAYCVFSFSTLSCNANVCHTFLVHWLVNQEGTCIANVEKAVGCPLLWFGININILIDTVEMILYSIWYCVDTVELTISRACIVCMAASSNDGTAFFGVLRQNFTHCV